MVSIWANSLSVVSVVRWWGEVVEEEVVVGVDFVARKRSCLGVRLRQRATNMATLCLVWLGSWVPTARQMLLKQKHYSLSGLAWFLGSSAFVRSICGGVGCLTKLTFSSPGSVLGYCVDECLPAPVI